MDTFLEFLRKVWFAIFLIIAIVFNLFVIFGSIGGLTQVESIGGVVSFLIGNGILFGLWYLGNWVFKVKDKTKDHDDIPPH